MVSNHPERCKHNQPDRRKNVWQDINNRLTSTPLEHKTSSSDNWINYKTIQPCTVWSIYGSQWTAHSFSVKRELKSIVVNTVCCAVFSLRLENVDHCTSESEQAALEASPVCLQALAMVSQLSMACPSWGAVSLSSTYYTTLHHFLHISLDDKWSIPSHILLLCKNCK